MSAARDNAMQDDVLEILPSSLDDTAPPFSAERAPDGVSERIVVRRPAGLPGVDLWVMRSTNRRFRHITEGYWFSRAGPRTLHRARAENRYRGNALEVVGDDVALLDPNEAIINTRSSGHLDMVNLCLAPAYIQQVLGVTAIPHFANFTPSDPTLSSLLWAANRAVAEPATDLLEREARLTELVVHAFAHHGERPPPLDTGSDSSLTRARELLEDRYAETLRLDDIASHARISKYHLERKFRAHFGVPLHQYLKLVRVRRAMERLRYGEPLSAVATEVGFSDQAHMTRTFRQVMGITPGAYRRGG